VPSRVETALSLAKVSIFFKSCAFDHKHANGLESSTTFFRATCHFTYDASSMMRRPGIDGSRRSLVTNDLQPVLMAATI
jgi:hypothetical protein